MPSAQTPASPNNLEPSPSTPQPPPTTEPRIRRVIVLGAGSAGLMTALALRRRAPELEVTVVRSPSLGVIGVGEGTTAAFPRFLFEQLRLKPGDFYRQARPTWKLGLRFQWGPRTEFYYSFDTELARQGPELAKPNGFYAPDGPEPPIMGRMSALMHADRAVPQQANGAPDLTIKHAFHIENRAFVGWLEEAGRALGVTFIDGLVEGVALRPEGGVRALHLDGDRTVEGDFFVDASGFRAELAGRALGEPFVSFADTLFCDRAVIGGWDRTTEETRPYTTCETMDHGWCWRIDHEEIINRGYVFSSAFVSDEEAAAEFLRKNPQVTTGTSVVKFRSGRLRRLWVENVVAIGNSGGFVEPLEATALQTIGTIAANLADVLHGSEGRPTPSLIRLFNRHSTGLWDDIRDFLSIHYRFNTRLDNPFWRHCRAEVALHGAEELVTFYRENGPSLTGAGHTLSPGNAFGLEGYYALLVGQQVPHERPYAPTPQERAWWEKHGQACRQLAARSLRMADGMALMRDPRLRWG